MLDCMTMFMMLNTDYDPLPPLVVNVYIFNLEMAGNSFCSQFDNQRVRYGSQPVLGGVKRIGFFFTQHDHKDIS